MTCSVQTSGRDEKKSKEQHHVEADGAEGPLLDECFRIGWVISNREGEFGSCWWTGSCGFFFSLNGRGREARGERWSVYLVMTILRNTPYYWTYGTFGLKVEEIIPI